MLDVKISKNGSMNFTIPYIGINGVVYANPNCRLFNDCRNVWFLEINDDLVCRFRNSEEIVQFLKEAAFHYAAA